MILVFLSAILIVFSAQLFTLNFAIQGLNRAIITTPIELMYRTVKLDSEGVKFSKDSFERELMKYYDSTLPRYSKEREIEFYYYNYEDESMCLEDYCNAVEITFNCKLTENYTFHRVMYYELRGKTNG